MISWKGGLRAAGARRGWAGLVVEGSLRQFSVVPMLITFEPGSGRPLKSVSADGTYVLVLPSMSRLILGVWTAEEVKIREKSAAPAATPRTRITVAAAVTIVRLVI